ncbi:hypothetical protein SLS58_002723 [Diplodia intermedia]|uniref:C6 transcription factor n=1 Tax=Diplodia intermedia TaxID=856260 RepID=A0ABR3TYF2_9PEZI
MSKWGTKDMYGTETSDTLEARMIRLIVDLISAPLASWTSTLAQTVNSLTPLYTYALTPGLAASLFWCTFRFDLAAALVNESYMTTDLDTLVALGRPSDGMCGVLEDIEPDDDADPACVDREAGDERPGQGRHQNYLAQWQNKWTELSAWYANRRRFVKPLLELSSSSSSTGEGTDASAFPTIIFSTAAATLANLVYHTAAMILLDCKPKTLKMPGPHHHHHHHSPTASPHWHAQRTCAIAVVGNNGNGNGNCNFFLENGGWDLCMLACVLRAARKMTHRDQQAAVLATLELARETTGWKIDGDVRSLQEFWRLAEHS